MVSNFILEENAHQNEKQTRTRSLENPREAMLFKARNEGEWGSQENDHSHSNMNPCAVRENRKGREKEGEKRNHYTVDGAGSGKGYSDAVPDFFHYGHIAECLQSVYNA